MLEMHVTWQILTSSAHLSYSKSPLTEIKFCFTSEENEVSHCQWQVKAQEIVLKSSLNNVFLVDPDACFLYRVVRDYTMKTAWSVRVTIPSKLRIVRATVNIRYIQEHKATATKENYGNSRRFWRWCVRPPQSYKVLTEHRAKIQLKKLFRWKFLNLDILSLKHTAKLEETNSWTAKQLRLYELKKAGNGPNQHRSISQNIHGFFCFRKPGIFEQNIGIFACFRLKNCSSKK